VKIIIIKVLALLVLGITFAFDRQSWVNGLFSDMSLAEYGVLFFLAMDTVCFAQMIRFWPSSKIRLKDHSTKIYFWFKLVTLSLVIILGVLYACGLIHGDRALLIFGASCIAYLVSDTGAFALLVFTSPNLTIFDLLD